MIAVLGHTNTETELSDVAKSRCSAAFNIWEERGKNEQVIVTGTFGKHFNTTNKSHFEYLKDYLNNLGVPKDKLKGTYSSNTYEDILGIRKICIDNAMDQITIVTSDFHAERTFFLGNRLLQNIDFDIKTVETVPGKKLSQYKKSERRSMKVAKQEIFDFPLYNSPNDTFPKEIHENASSEHKHYDNLSIVTVTGQFVIFGFGINFLNKLPPQENPETELQSMLFASILLILFIFLFWRLYHRTAKTARVARKLLRSLEISYGRYGFSSLFQKQKFAKEFFSTVQIVDLVFALQLMAVLLILFEKLTIS